MTRFLTFALLVGLLPGCTGSPTGADHAGAPSPPSAAATPQAPPRPVPASPVPAPRKLAITVHKTASCGCCSGWVEHLRQQGFDVSVVEETNLAATRQALGVPAHLGSCHTAEIQGMFVEGHVPAADIRQMVADRAEGAAIRGIAVPGMPAGSPGMEMGARVDPYDVIQVSPDGQEKVFAHHPGMGQ